MLLSQLIVLFADQMVVIFNIFIQKTQLTITLIALGGFHISCSTLLSCTVKVHYIMCEILREVIIIVYFTVGHMHLVVCAYKVCMCVFILLISVGDLIIYRCISKPILVLITVCFSPVKNIISLSFPCSFWGSSVYCIVHGICNSRKGLLRCHRYIWARCSNKLCRTGSDPIIGRVVKVFLIGLCIICAYSYDPTCRHHRSDSFCLIIYSNCRTLPVSFLHDQTSAHPSSNNQY